MKLIPAIDLMDGQVVTAKRGERHAYAPSATPLCPSSRPRDVIGALLALHPFDTFYLADLDAICAKGSNLELIQRLQREFPGTRFWVDNGLTELERLCEIARPVIGSESLVSCTKLTHMLASLPSPILSLDYLGEDFKGPSGLERRTELWPKDVILMTLSRVGSAGGPDIARLQRLAHLLPEQRLYAAGGVRDRRDLERLRTVGVAGVLLSTALHQGTIDGMEIGRFLSI